MTTKYVHTNLISKDWRKLADFYITVLDCKESERETHLFGDWLEKAVCIKKADLKGIKLTFPGYDKNGPTLEIFQYTENLEKAIPIAANREGLGHLAFQVEDVQSILDKIISNGGNKFGEVVTKEFKSGTLTFTYASDPEGNLIELMNWTPK